MKVKMRESQAVSYFKVKNNRIIYFKNVPEDPNNYSIFVLPMISLSNLFCINNTVGYYENGKKVIIDTYDSSYIARVHYYNCLCDAIYNWHKRQGRLTVIKSLFKWIFIPFISAILVISLYSTILQGIAFQQFYFSNLTTQTESNQKNNYELEPSSSLRQNLPQNNELVPPKQNSIIGTKQLATILEDGTRSNEFTINSVHPTSKTKLFVFSDPLCPYCKKLDKVLDEVRSDYSVYIFPVNVISNELVLDNLGEISCEPDIQRKLSLWHSLINDSYSLVDTKINQTCIDRIEGNSKVFRSLNVSGTPAVFNENGVQVPNNVLSDSSSLKSWVSSNGQ